MRAGVRAGACVSLTPVDQLLSCDVQLLTTCPGALVSSLLTACPGDLVSSLMPPLVPASVWTSKDIRQFKDTMRKNPVNIVRISSLATATVSS